MNNTNHREEFRQTARRRFANWFLFLSPQTHTHTHKSFSPYVYTLCSYICFCCCCSIDYNFELRKPRLYGVEEFRLHDTNTYLDEYIFRAAQREAMNILRASFEKKKKSCCRARTTCCSFLARVFSFPAPTS